MNWKDNLSAEEKICMEELRKRTLKDLTPDLLEDETLFYRFSKARDFVIKDAEAMLRKHIIWREQYKVDRILKDYKPKEVLSKHNPFNFIGYDKEGSPVIFFDFGNCDMKGILNSVTPNQFCNFGIYILEGVMEKLRTQTEKLGKPVTMLSFIVEFGNLPFSTATNKKLLETMMCLAKIFQDNYPERMKSAYYINASFYFSLFFSVLKVTLALAVLSKIRIFRPNDDLKSALLEKIDPEVLPAFLGGTRTDPDGNPMCTSVIPPACKVPENYYLVKSEKKLSRSEDAQKMIVTRRSKEMWTCEVTEPGSYLEWEFETKKNDIGFSVLHKPDRDSNSNELLPRQKMNTYYEPEIGFIRCDKPGTYICVFDNSYSLINSVEIYFKIQVSPPREVDILPDSLLSDS